MRLGSPLIFAPANTYCTTKKLDLDEDFLSRDGNFLRFHRQFSVLSPQTYALF